MSIVSTSGRLFYTKYNVASTGFVYDSNGNADSDTGWQNCQADYIVVQTRLATHLRSGNLTLRIEGKFDTMDRAASIKTAVYTAAQDIDELHVIDERLKEIRVGVKSDTVPASLLASPCYVYAGLCLTEAR